MDGYKLVLLGRCHRLCRCHRKMCGVHYFSRKIILEDISFWLSWYTIQRTGCYEFHA